MLETDRFPGFPLTSDPQGKVSAELRSRGRLPLDTPRESACPLDKAEPQENGALCHAGDGVSTP